MIKILSRQAYRFGGDLFPLETDLRLLANFNPIGYKPLEALIFEADFTLIGNNAAPGSDYLKRGMKGSYIPATDSYIIDSQANYLSESVNGVTTLLFLINNNSLMLAVQNAQANNGIYSTWGTLIVSRVDTTFIQP